jgi:hypothetical protein
MCLLFWFHCTLHLIPSFAREARRKLCSDAAWPSYSWSASVNGTHAASCSACMLWVSVFLAAFITKAAPHHRSRLIAGAARAPQLLGSPARGATILLQKQGGCSMGWLNPLMESSGEQPDFHTSVCCGRFSAWRWRNESGSGATFYCFLCAVPWATCGSCVCLLL